MVIRGLSTVLCLIAVQTQSARAQQPAAAQVDSARAAVARSIIPRVENGPPAPPPASWMSYLGEYGSTHHPLVILEHGGSLHALAAGVSLEPLRNRARDVFAFSDSQTLTFVRNAAGRVTSVKLSNAVLERRPIGPDEGVTFRIVPRKPRAELERAALAAAPPQENGDFLPTDLVELRSLDPTIRYDIRYATRNNFMGEVFYSSPHAYMQRAAAEAVARASQRLKTLGYGLIIHDAYRPWYVTKMFWDATPDSLRDFVADPANGSRHNRGAAVDLSLYDLKTGETVTTVSGYDEFSPRAFPDYAGGTTRQRWYRAALREAMEAEGFTVYRNEWWHFDYGDWRRYRIGNQRFEELR
jgi:D-alanyl-D-alanine dipeptidase